MNESNRIKLVVEPHFATHPSGAAAAPVLFVEVDGERVPFTVRFTDDESKRSK